MSTQRTPHKLFEGIRATVSAIVVATMLVAGFWASHYFAPGHSDLESHGAAERESEIPTEITLSPQKIASANIRMSDVQCIDLQEKRTLTAIIDYDSTRHLSVRAPVECVVLRWLVSSGDVVKAGDPLAVLSGAEIALARTEIKKGEANVRIAQINFDWSKETQDNLEELLATLRKYPKVEAVKSQFEGKRLGEHRDHLLTTYTQFVLANRVANRSKPLGEQGIISGSMAEARSSQRDVAATLFRSACEQSEFEGQHELAKAQAELELAQQNLAVAEGHLRLLLGPFADGLSTGELGDFEVLAPFGGRIESVHASPALRLAHGEPVLTLADTTKLWVSALIHQHDWAALQVGAAETLSVTVPGVSDGEFTATVSFVGPEVARETRAVSLVAELDNQHGRLRPGMFAWVALPVEPPHQGLVVPTSAIQRHESNAFVFVADDRHRFRRVDVSTGIETPEYVEITQGLVAGQSVVDRGAFQLKSELLLEQDEE